MCDCCDSESDVQVFPTDDDDCVLLCEPCRAMLSDMVSGTALDGLYTTPHNSVTPPDEDGKHDSTTTTG